MYGDFIIIGDSKSTIEQLRGLSEICNIMLQRIYRAIKRALNEITFPYAVIFTYLERTRNIAGLMLIISTSFVISQNIVEAWLCQVRLMLDGVNPNQYLRRHVNKGIYIYT